MQFSFIKSFHTLQAKYVVSADDCLAIKTAQKAACDHGRCCHRCETSSTGHENLSDVTRAEGFLDFSVALTLLLWEHCSVLLNRQMWRCICSQQEELGSRAFRGLATTKQEDHQTKYKTTVKAITHFMCCRDVLCPSIIWCLFMSSKFTKLVTALEQDDIILSLLITLITLIGQWLHPPSIHFLSPCILCRVGVGGGA